MDSHRSVKPSMSGGGGLRESVHPAGELQLAPQATSDLFHRTPLSSTLLHVRASEGSGPCG